MLPVLKPANVSCERSIHCNVAILRGQKEEVRMNKPGWTPIGLGTWMMEKEPKASVLALRVGIEAGANHVDTAEMYGQGRVEEIVGEAITGLRDKIFLVSKVLPSNADYEGTLQACARSLKR